jgi:hypothetical protein
MLLSDDGSNDDNRQKSIAKAIFNSFQPKVIGMTVQDVNA